MPVYAGGRPAGWTIDFMRRNTEPGTCRGVMEFLIATAALTFREEGARFVSLSGAPLARMDRGEQPCAVQRLLDMIANTMEPVYGFKSLLDFKAKFQPVYQPLYLTYPDPAALGPIAIAIGRAYLPHLTSRQGLRLLTKIRWPHANRGPVQQRERRRIRRAMTRKSPAGSPVGKRGRVDCSGYAELKATAYERRASHSATESAITRGCTESNRASAVADIGGTARSASDQDSSVPGRPPHGSEASRGADAVRGHLPAHARRRQADRHPVTSASVRASDYSRAAQDRPAHRLRVP